MVLAGERKLRGVGMGIEMNERRSTLAATKETKIETMADLERERNMNDENRTAMMKEGEIGRGSAMIKERKKILVGGRTEGEREEMLMEAERRGETEEEIALRKETERGKEERETEIGIGIEGEEMRGDDKIYPVCKTDDHAPHKMSYNILHTTDIDFSSNYPNTMKLDNTYTYTWLYNVRSRIDPCLVHAHTSYNWNKMEIKVVLLLTVLASLAFATEEIKRARLEVSMIFKFLLRDKLSACVACHSLCRLAVDDDSIRFPR